MGLHTFSDDLEAERSSESDDSGYQVGPAGINVTDELPVNLDVVEGKTTKQVEIVLLGPEIVNRESHTLGSQCGERG
ncbi:hypothetical protein PTKU15_83900 [Paraburkholderia terrae]|nr:hypothetical protein PTKU15_83900 [Paraburkholderia terrae]